MLRLRLFVGLAAGFVLCSAAAAGQPDSDHEARLKLARQIVELQGGTASLQARMRAIVTPIMDAAAANFPSSEAKLRKEVLYDILDETMKLVPPMLDAMTDVYAEHLTISELRDYETWLRSDTGRVVTAKLPEVEQETLQRLLPLYVKTFPEIQQKVVDRACEAEHCSAQEEEVVAAAVSKAFSARKS